MRRFAWTASFVLALLSACSPAYKLHRQMERTEAEFHDHIGFTLFDPVRKKTLYDHQGDRYFIPASNTKIFTLYAALRILGDSIPALRYVTKGDSLIFWGTGDPSFLYDDVVASTRTLDFLSQFDSLYFSGANFDTDHFGPGWAWGDYRYAYQVERTPFPIYGNRFHMKKSGANFVPSPRIFSGEVEHAPYARRENDLIRGIDSNALRYVPGSQDSSLHWEIPFRYSHDLLARLLADTLKKPVRVIQEPLPAGSATLHSVPADSVYKVMMQESDNFIAEQLLLACAARLSDTLRTDIAIREARKQFLSDLPDPPVWVDGSGLSRMNLFTPRSIVALWDKTSQLVPRERLFSLLAVGGVSGTIRNNYKADQPYVFGKTGTLRNNHSLSGFIVTRKGTVLLFSWMNNNFTAPAGAVRVRMEEILKFIRDAY